MLVQAPTLYTPRILLRAFTPDDIQDLLTMWNEPEVIKFTSGKAKNETEVWNNLLQYVGHWTLHGFGPWCAIERSSGRFLGSVGLMHYKRPYLAGHKQFYDLSEASWTFCTWSHGQGFATEALQAMFEWADEHLELTNTMCIIHPHNTPSIHLAIKMAYAYDSSVPYEDTEIRIYTRQRILNSSDTLSI